MSTKATLAQYDGGDRKPSWHLYEEVFEAGVAYLELRGVGVEVSTREHGGADVVVRLPIETLTQLALHTNIPPERWESMCAADKLEPLAKRREGWAEASKAISGDIDPEMRSWLDAPAVGSEFDAQNSTEPSNCMSGPSIEALASTWARIAEEAKFPADYEGTASPEAYRASEAIQERIRNHIVAAKDMRLFGLLHLLGHASLRMEQALWPEEYQRVASEIEAALREADDLNARSYSDEEVRRSMRERIDRARGKSR